MSNMPVLAGYLCRVWQQGEFCFQLSFIFFSVFGVLSKNVSALLNEVTSPFIKGNLSANRINRTKKGINAYIVSSF